MKQIELVTGPSQTFNVPLNVIAWGDDQLGERMIALTPLQAVELIDVNDAVASGIELRLFSRGEC